MSLTTQDPAALRYPRALVVMVKTPRPGQCKTRLCPPLTHEEAAQMYRSFLEDIGRELKGWSFEGDLWVAWSDDHVSATDLSPNDENNVESSTSDSGADRAEPVPEALKACFDTPFRFLRQEGTSLTERMESVFDELFAKGYQQVVMRNSDSPHLPTCLLSTAFDALADKRGKLVLGPDLDGGYYLVGLDVPPDGLLPSVMSSKDVLEETVRNAEQRSMQVELLEPFLDIDTADDLLTFWLEFGGRADVRQWSTYKLLNDHPMIDRLGA